ncbi:MAG: hypothetical protein JKY37_08170 [Nannocystaceae bacterium]|nr:hypothetical protein [Nannocystaceae bacterium]
MCEVSVVLFVRANAAAPSDPRVQARGLGLALCDASGSGLECGALRQPG